MKKEYLLLLAIGLIVFIYEATSFSPVLAKLPSRQTSEIVKKEDIDKVGKQKATKVLPNLYNKSFSFFSPLDNDENELPKPTKTLVAALAQQAKLIGFKRNETHYEGSNLKITTGFLDSTVQLLQLWTKSPNEVALSDLFETYLLKGRDRKGNSKFTGYFSPVIEVSEVRTPEYSVPIYKKPDNDSWEGSLPTRGEILYEDALKGKDLVLAWAKSTKDVRNLQLQGSGFAKYPNGKTEYFGYGGSNNRSKGAGFSAEKVSMGSPEADSIARQTYKRPGYTFFQRLDREKALGAGSVHISPNITVAVDPNIVPLGSCLIAEVPVLDKKGKLLYHELRILLAQDTGGAIKGSGRFDYYTGVGKEAFEKARYLNHYGRVWLLAPKK